MTLRALKHLARTPPSVREGVKLPWGKNAGLNTLVPLDGSFLLFVEDVGVGEINPSIGDALQPDLNLLVTDRIMYIYVTLLAIHHKSI